MPRKWFFGIWLLHQSPQVSQLHSTTSSISTSRIRGVSTCIHYDGATIWNQGPKKQFTVGSTKQQSSARSDIAFLRLVNVFRCFLIRNVSLFEADWAQTRWKQVSMLWPVLFWTLKSRSQHQEGTQISFLLNNKTFLCFYLLKKVKFKVSFMTFPLMDNRMCDGIEHSSSQTEVINTGSRCLSATFLSVVVEGVWELRIIAFYTLVLVNV